jgi:hypothetical protein
LNPEQRLAQLVTILENAGLQCLVMGGHAVRYYGVGRNTIDFIKDAEQPPSLRLQIDQAFLSPLRTVAPGDRKQHALEENWCRFILPRFRRADTNSFPRRCSVRS